MSELTAERQKELGIKDMQESVKSATANIHIPYADVAGWHTGTIQLLHHMVVSHKMAPADVLSTLTHVFELSRLVAACEEFVAETRKYDDSK